MKCCKELFLYMLQDRKANITGLWPTRWAEHHESVLLPDDVYYTLKEISTRQDTDYASIAMFFINSILEAPCNISFNTLHKFFLLYIALK
jgi:hypothetical protein